MQASDRRTFHARIPDLIRTDRRTPQVETLGAAEFRNALHAKLREEVDELLAAEHRDVVLEEAAAILEVLTAIVADHGATLDSIVDVARAKRQQRGGFDMRVWLNGVDP